MLTVGTLCFMLLSLLCLPWVQMGSKSCELSFPELEIWRCLHPSPCLPGLPSWAGTRQAGSEREQLLLAAGSARACGPPPSPLRQPVIKKVLVSSRGGSEQ